MGKVRIRSRSGSHELSHQGTATAPETRGGAEQKPQQPPDLFLLFFLLLREGRAEGEAFALVLQERSVRTFFFNYLNSHTCLKMLKVILQKWKLDCGTAGEEDWISEELPGLECVCCYLIFLDIH